MWEASPDAECYRGRETSPTERKHVRGILRLSFAISHFLSAKGGRHHPCPVIAAKAGIHDSGIDSRLRGVNDEGIRFTGNVGATNNELWISFSHLLNVTGAQHLRGLGMKMPIDVEVYPKIPPSCVVRRLQRTGK